MRVTLVLPPIISERLLELATLPEETGAVLLTRAVQSGSGEGLRLLAAELAEVPTEAYAARGADHLSVTSDGYVPALARAESMGAIPLWLHTHPGSESQVSPSEHDALVDVQLADLFRLRADSPYYGAVVVGHTDGRLRFTGHIESEQQVLAISRMWLVGDRLRLVPADDAEAAFTSPMFDRNVRAFGGDIQRVLGDLRVGVVGCGGTGSAVIEQLARLGVCDFVLIDPDKLSESNVTRVYGSSLKRVDQFKTVVAEANIQRISQDARVRRHEGMLTTEATARALGDVDVVFGCTDDNAGRMVLSRIATYMLTPVIDCGVLLSSNEEGQLIGIDGRITVLTPGGACLLCRNRIDLSRARSELLTPDERVRLVDEGYAPALAGVEPAVVTFTTTVAAAAVNELLERLTGYGTDHVPNEVLLRLHDREMSVNRQEPTPMHYCHVDSGKWGRGVTEPFLEQTWVE